MRYYISLFLLFSLQLPSSAQVVQGPSLCLALELESSIDSLDKVIQTRLSDIIHNDRIYKKYIHKASSFSRIALKTPSEHFSVTTDCNLTFLDVEYFKRLKMLHVALEQDLSNLDKSSSNPPPPNHVTQKDAKSIDGLSFEEMEHNEISYKVVIFDLTDTTYSLQLHLGNKGGKTKHSSFQTLLKDHPGTRMIMNAGMYTKDHKAQGLYIEDGVTLQALNLSKKTNGNFYLDPSGVFILDSLGVPSILNRYNIDSTSLRKARIATQSGPLLLIDNSLHPIFKKHSKHKHIRNGVGIANQGKLIVFMISMEPVTFYDFALVFKERYGCRDALYLDGAISQLYAPELNCTKLSGKFGPLLHITQ